MNLVHVEARFRQRPRLTTQPRSKYLKFCPFADTVTLIDLRGPLTRRWHPVHEALNCLKFCRHRTTVFVSIQNHMQATNVATVTRTPVVPASLLPCCANFILVPERPSRPFRHRQPCNAPKRQPSPAMLANANHKQYERCRRTLPAQMQMQDRVPQVCHASI